MTRILSTHSKLCNKNRYSNCKVNQSGIYSAEQLARILQFKMDENDLDFIWFNSRNYGEIPIVSNYRNYSIKLLLDLIKKLIKQLLNIVNPREREREGEHTPVKQQQTAAAHWNRFFFLSRNFYNFSTCWTLVRNSLIKRKENNEIVSLSGTAQHTMPPSPYLLFRAIH